MLEGTGQIRLIRPIRCHIYLVKSRYQSLGSVSVWGRIFEVASRVGRNKVKAVSRGAVQAGRILADPHPSIHAPLRSALLRMLVLNPAPKVK